MRFSKRYFPAIISVWISGLFPVAHALEFEPSIGAGLAYSDNANLVSNNEEEDTAVVGYLGARLSEDSGPLLINVSSDITYQKYLNDTVGDQTYFRLGSTAVWEQKRDRLYWDVSDYYSQRKIDTLSADRNSNLQNTNIFTLGPRIEFRPSSAHVVSVIPQYRNFYYQESNADNQQYGLTTNWLYQMRPTMQVGLNGRVNATDYDDENQNPNTVSSIVQAVLSGTGSRSSYTINAGGTRVSRDKFDSVSGFSGSATWLQQLTGASSLRIFLASRLTNGSDSFLGSQSNPDNGSFASGQINGDVVRSNRVSVVYRKTGSTLTTAVSAQVLDLDYEETPDDRRIYDLNTSLRYNITPLVDGNLIAIYQYLDEDATDRTDKLFSITGTISYRLSSKLRTEFAVRFQDKSSDLSTEEYTEKAVFIGLIWGNGSIPRTGILNSANISGGNINSAR